MTARNRIESKLFNYDVIKISMEKKKETKKIKNILILNKKKGLLLVVPCFPG